MRTRLLRPAAWSAALLLLAPAAAAQIDVSVDPSTGGWSNQIVHVAIEISNPGAAPVDAFGFVLTYPAQLLTFQSVSTAGTLTAAWFALSGTESIPGTVNVGGFHTTPLAGSGVLLYAVFQVKPNVLGSGPVALGSFVDDLAGASSSAGSFTASVAPGAAGLFGEYYDNINFTGALVTRVDPVVNFDWAGGAPDPSMGVNDYSIRWTGWVQPDFTETYTFYTQTDDGVRLWVNNQLIIDRWVDQSVREWSGTIALTAGAPVPIRMEFYERGGDAVARLLWSAPSIEKQIIPSPGLLAAACAQGIGDVDGNGLLAATDVACAFEVFLGGQSLAGACNYQDYACEVVSADVNCDGVVTPADAQAIEARRAAGLLPSACFATAAPPAAGAPFQIALLQTVVDEGGTPRLCVSVAVQDASGLDAFGARLSFPSGELAFQRADAAFVTGGWYAVDGAAAGSGQVLLGGFDAFSPAPPGPAELVRVYFDFLGTPGTVGGLFLSDLVDDLEGASVAGTVTGAGSPLPASRLLQNHPNPFNPVTRIPYQVGGAPGAGVPVRIAIYDVRGALVRVLVDEARAPGAYAVEWDGRTSNGTPAASGVYVCALRAGAFTASRRMVLLK
jgi:hypothetical protein